MCSTSFPSVFIVSGIRAWAMEGAVFAKLYHRVIAATTKDFWDILTYILCIYYIQRYVLHILHICLFKYRRLDSDPDAVWTMIYQHRTDE